MTIIRNLGAVLSVLARAEAAEHFVHADICAFGAPGECHALAQRGEAGRLRLARKQAEALARAPMRAIRAQAIRRGNIDPCSAQPAWLNIVGRTYAARYPF